MKINNQVLSCGDILRKVGVSFDLGVQKGENALKWGVRCHFYVFVGFMVTLRRGVRGLGRQNC